MTVENQLDPDILANIADCYITLGDWETAAGQYSAVQGREVTSRELQLERRLWSSDLTDMQRSVLERDLERVRSGNIPLKPHEELVVLNRIANEARKEGRVSSVERFINEDLSKTSP